MGDFFNLSLAYTPGVAAPVRAIADNPALVDHYTIKNNLVAVISDGSAVLGLGWSSWKTRMSSSAIKRCSISKQRGAEISSKLMPPKVAHLI
jgi:hypothetical protein